MKDTDEESTAPWNVKESRGRWKPGTSTGVGKSLRSCRVEAKVDPDGIPRYRERVCQYV